MHGIDCGFIKIEHMLEDDQVMLERGYKLPVFRIECPKENFNAIHNDDNFAEGLVMEGETTETLQPQVLDHMYCRN